jgi:hypothetical protein
MPAGSMSLMALLLVIALAGCAQPHFAKLDPLGKAIPASGERLQLDLAACRIVGAFSDRRFFDCMRAKGYIAQPIQ